KLNDIRFAYWKKSGIIDKVQLHIAAAADVAQELDTVFDLIFIDADKKNYGLYYDQWINKMKVGGILIADNTLFHGEVFGAEHEQSNSAKAIHLFNQKIANDPRVEQVLLPMRDGLTIIRKI